jgi:Fe-S cluster biosynthesis and repair protein YggX
VLKKQWLKKQTISLLSFRTERSEVRNRKLIEANLPFVMSNEAQQGEKPFQTKPNTFNK